jgi:hypothetical protein
MRLSRCSLLLFVAGVLAPLAWAGARDALVEWRALTAENRQRLAKFVSDWRSLDGESQNRLRRVMVRYSEWLARLTADERNSIERLPTLEKKLARIRQIRERQWLARLPKAERDKIEAAKSEEDRRKLTAEAREVEHRRELTWELYLLRNEDQAAFTQQFTQLNKEVFAKLSPPERQRLDAARKEGRPASVKLLFELAQEHGVAVPPLVASRVALLTNYPPLPDDKLLEFTKSLLNETARDDYLNRLVGDDPVQRVQAMLELTHLYWEMHPQRLKRAREAEELRKRQRQMGK